MSGNFECCTICRRTIDEGPGWMYHAAGKAHIACVLLEKEIARRMDNYCRPAAVSNDRGEAGA